MNVGNVILPAQRSLSHFCQRANMAVAAPSTTTPAYGGKSSCACAVRRLASISGVAFFVAFVTISYLHIVIGELAPKSMAIRMSERVALWTAAPLFAFYWSMYPFIKGLNQRAFWVLRKLGLELKQQEATVPVYTVAHIERPGGE